MEDLKLIIAKNITELRKQQDMTQAELAEKLNYSDKAVSKWERGESIPDVTVLKAIADMFGVKVDFLLTADHDFSTLTVPHKNRHIERNHKLILGMCLMLVALIATFVFVVLQSISPDGVFQWMSFVFAVPAAMIVWLVLNTIWFNPKRNFMIISALVWSVLVCIYLSLLLYASYNAWLLFFIGIPAQIIVILWSGIRTKK
jgi:transcriptional regulator with XRE-family HTH domain